MQNNKCDICLKNIEENYEFCPYCGNPLTALSQDTLKQQCINAQLQIIIKLIDDVKDVNTLKLLKTYADKLSKK